MREVPKDLTDEKRSKQETVSQAEVYLHSPLFIA